MTVVLAMSAAVLLPQATAGAQNGAPSDHGPNAPSFAHLSTTCGGFGPPTIRGTSGNDTITGTSGPDVIWGGGGNDTINGLGGNDVIIGGPGDDIIYGGFGPDHLCGGDGNDTIYGQDGNDIMTGQAGNDSLHGGNHQDVLFGEDGSDTIQGQSGHDIIDGGKDSDTITGGWGNDQIVAGWGNDTVNGNGAADQIWGGPGDDTLRGGDGNDMLSGGYGDDILWGGNHADELFGDWDDDTLDGENGNDAIEGGRGLDTAAGGAHSDYCGSEYRTGGCETTDGFGASQPTLAINAATDATSITESDALQCANLVEGVPIIQPGRQSGLFGRVTDWDASHGLSHGVSEYFGYVWVPDGWSLQSDASIEIFDLGGYSGWSGVHVVVQGVKLTIHTQSPEQFEGNIYTGSNTTPNFYPVPNHSEASGGRYELTGIDLGGGGGGLFSYDVEMSLVPDNGNYNTPAAAEPCRLLHDIEAWSDYYDSDLIAAMYGVQAAAETIVESLPLHSCVDTANDYFVLNSARGVSVVEDVVDCARSGIGATGSGAPLTSTIGKVSFVVSVANNVDVVLLDVLEVDY